MISADELIKKLEKWRAEQPIEYRLVRCDDEVGFINWDDYAEKKLHEAEMQMFGKPFKEHLKELREP